MAEAPRKLLLLNLRCDADYPPLAFALDWIEEIAARVDHVHVITNWRGRYSPPANVTLTSLGAEKNTPNPVRLWRLWRAAAKALADPEVALVFGHMTPLFSLLVAPLARLRRRPSVLWYAHGHVPRMLRAAVRAVDLCVTSSEAGFRVDTPKLRVLSQGVSTRRFAAQREAPRPDEPVVFLNVGRVAPLKRVEICIDAFAKLPPEDRTRARLRIIGDPLREKDRPYHQWLKRRVGELGLDGQVTVEPSAPFAALPALYGASHAFVNCAPLHSIDKASLEAMAAGLPALVTNPAYVPAMGEAMAPLCVESGDPRDLAAAMSRLIRMAPADRRALGRSLAAEVEARHSLTALVDRLFGVFGEALELRR
jgi:glycosyltransferase involved in cell wall biosynthesis